jgi:protein arginine kinase activator
MQCQVCKQDEATVHLTQIVDDDVRSLDLCVGCAKQKGVSDPLGFSFADVFKEAAPEGAAGEAEAGKVARAARAEVQCSRCGLGHADFKKTGRLGCSDCYEAFAGVLDGMLKGMHKGIRHTGKMPMSAMHPVAARTVPGTREGGKDAEPAQSAGEELDRLSVQLAEAVAREAFEEAARLRDQIRAAKLAAPTERPQNEAKP